MGSANLTVGPPTVTGLQITPGATTIGMGSAISFTVMEILSNNTTQPPSNPIVWTNGTPATANLVILPANNNENVSALGLMTGMTTITATEGTLTAHVALTVAAIKTHFAFVSNNLDGNIQWYTVSTTTSPYLTSGGTLAVATHPTQTVVHPSGQFVYYTDSSTNLWFATVDSTTGALTASGVAGQKAGAGHSNFIAIDPYGRFVYVSDDGGSATASQFTIYGFSINLTHASSMAGSLTPIPGSPFTMNLSQPECLIIDHTGSFLYAVNEAGHDISAYSINQMNGALTPLSTPTFPTGVGPYLGGLDPSGTHLYVVNTAPTNTISGFSIGAGGLLTSVGADFAVPGATLLENLVVDPSGTHIYVLDGGNTSATPQTNGKVFGFDIGSGGVIGSAISGSPVATNLGPLFGIVIDSTGTLLANENSLSNNISLYTVGSGGALTSQTPVNTGMGPLYVTLYNAP